MHDSHAIIVHYVTSPEESSDKLEFDLNSLKSVDVKAPSDLGIKHGEINVMVWGCIGVGKVMLLMTQTFNSKDFIC